MARDDWFGYQEKVAGKEPRFSTGIIVSMRVMKKIILLSLVLVFSASAFAAPVHHHHRRHRHHHHHPAA